MHKNILICGVGGQGALFASRLIACAAMARGLSVRTAETIGMAQRGGPVVSHVRIGPSHSPMIPHGQADLILALEPAEAVRCLSYLKPGGTIVASTKAIRPVSASLMGGGYAGGEMLGYIEPRAKLHAVDVEAICRAGGSERAANMALLGAAAGSGALGISLSEIEAILEEAGGKHPAANQSALRLGAQAVKKGENTP